MSAPYWQSNDGAITVYNGDMLDVLPQLAVDVIVTDAPFGIGDAPLGARDVARTGKRTGNGARYHAPSDWDADIDPAWCRAACDAAPIVAWFGSWRRAHDVMRAMTHPVRCEIIWAKDTHVGPPCPAAMRDERIWIFSADTFEGQHFETTIWNEPIIPTWEHRWHKNQKPEKLMGRLIRWVASPSALICDPFMGSGSTLFAAQRLGRRCIGIEKNKDHCDAAVARLGAASKSAPIGPLFDLTPASTPATSPQENPR